MDEMCGLFLVLLEFWQLSFVLVGDGKLRIV